MITVKPFIVKAIYDIINANPDKTVLLDAPTLFEFELINSTPYFVYLFWSLYHSFQKK